MKTQQLATEVEAHKVTKDSLEKARRDVKKKNVLSLEMEDYERSMKELSTKMEESKKKMMQVSLDCFYIRIYTITKVLLYVEIYNTI